MPSSRERRQAHLRLAKLRIFTVAVAALAILSVLAYLLSGGTWLKPKTYLLTYIPDATGLEPGADVLLNGVNVGTVESVRLASSRDLNRVVEVRMKVEVVYLPYIPSDSLTDIDSSNLLGDEYVDITIGKSAQHVRAGGVLPHKPPSALMQNIDLRQFDAQLRTIDQLLADIQTGKGPLGQFVVSEALYYQFVQGVVKVEKQMRAAVSSQSQLGQALYSAAQHDSLMASVKQLDDRLAQIQANRMLRDTSQYDQIRDQLVKLHKTLADLNAGKGAGGRLMTSDDTYVEWTNRLAAWAENIDALNSGEGPMGRMLSSAQAYELLTGQMRELQTTIKELRTDPQKLLRLKIF